VSQSAAPPPYAPAALPPGKEPPNSFNSRLGGPESQSVRFGEKKHISCIWRDPNPGSSSS
jgi:hypothetical protein